MPTGLFTLTQVNQAIRQGAWTGFIAPTWVEYLVVAGGGGGGSYGGGGAGGLLSGVVNILPNTSYTVTVGAGGGGSAQGVNGANSVFGVITSTGGGGGGGSQNIEFGRSGGSGGGSGVAVAAANFPGQGVAGQGNQGGFATLSNTTYYPGGGGGGAGTVGLNGSVSGVNAGNGGAGIASSISGVVVAYAGGGGGGAWSSAGGSVGGSGGVGGGGQGGSVTTTMTAGGGNTGGGGGALGSGGLSGASGGSGIVIIRYPGTVQYFTGGTLSYANGYVIHTFYSSGTLAPTTPTPYVATDYQISRSLRFNSADSAYLNRTPASAGNRRTWTWSGWVKRSALTGSRQGLFVCVDSAGNIYTGLEFNAADQLVSYDSNAPSSFSVVTTQVFRDVSAWYHIVWAYDTTQATASNRVKIYVNGSQVTNFATADYPTQNSETRINTTNSHSIGSWLPATGFHLNGYMTEVNFIDGQALTPSSFGYYDFNTGVWTPTRFVGTYGTNGFYLNFSDNSNTTAATLGRDYSGNSNNWTPNNFSVSAGAGNDSLVDVPTNWGTDTGVGGSVRGNYCTLNPLDKGPNVTITNGNLSTTNNYAGTPFECSRATIGVATGKWYWEVTATTVVSNSPSVGIASAAASLTNYLGADAQGWGYVLATGQKANNATLTSYGASIANGDIVGVALDMDAGTLVFFKNGVSQGTAFTGLTGTLFPAVFAFNTSVMDFNFGQRPFAYTAPSGFRALNTQNLPTPTIGATTATQANKYFDVVLRNGGGSSGGTYSTTINMANGAWLWDKPRSSTSDHFLVDSVRGISRTLSSNTTGAEATYANWFTGFNNGSFTTGSADWGTGTTVVDWIWAANGAGVTNTAGSITSTVSANTTSGFSVATFTTPSSGAFTFGHGLGAAPAMVIAKARATAGLAWVVYHRAIGPTQYLALNGTGAAVTLSSVWNDTAPTSTVVSTTAAGLGASQTYVAYCFAEVPGYSRFGSYTGNGSADGPFVFCGFRPAYVMVKSATESWNWFVLDSVRDTFNVAKRSLLPNNATAELDNANYQIDILSNGFKVRTLDPQLNGSGQTIIFAAFATAPQKFALAR